MAARPICFLLTVIATLFAVMGEATPHGGHGGKSYINYTTVTGFFLQDEPNYNFTGFDYATVNLGLINRTYETDRECGPEKTQWERFEYYVRKLNKNAPRNIDYKVLIMGRHGEGFHNVAESYYGTPAWNCYWALQDGNGTATWADARLTSTPTGGIFQANKAHGWWTNALANAGIPAPEGYYSSPLTRCLETARLTFEGLDLPHGRKFKPVVKEGLRETIGRHTCDRRSSKSYIKNTYPGFRIERGFAENDQLWDPVLRETNPARDARLKALLDDVFSNDDGTFLSFSAHSGAIGSILSVIKHQNFSLGTGQIIPVLVKAEKFGGQPPTATIPGPTPGTTCAANPTRTA